MTRSEFKLLNMFVDLVLDALSEVVRPGGALWSERQEDRGKFTKKTEILKLYIALQRFFKDRMGPLQEGDAYLDVFGTRCWVTCQDNGKLDMPSGVFIRLPLTIDDRNPEAFKRSLWGMVDWDRFSDKFISTDGSFLIMKRRGEELHNIVATPTEAILKALCAQEGMII